MSKAPRKTYVILDHANKLADRENINPNLKSRLQRSRVDGESPETSAGNQDDAGSPRADVNPEAN